jgi:hypothetical protein
VETIDAGTTVYRAYVGVNPENWWIDEGVVTEIVHDGVQLVRMNSILVPLTDQWRATKGNAKADYEAALVRYIGVLTKRLDTLRDEILHETLTTGEVVA